MLLKQKSLSLPRNLDLWTFGKLLSVLNKGKSTIPLLFQGCCFLLLVKQNYLLKTFLRTLILMTRVSLYLSSLLSLKLKLHNVSVAPKMVKKVITNLNSSKASGPDCIPVVIPKNCEHELSYVLAEIFNMCLKKSCFPGLLGAVLVPVFKNVRERSIAKNYHPVSLLSVVSKVFEKLVNNRIVDHLEKSGLFSDFQYGFRSSRSTADLLTVVSDRIARAFNRSGDTGAVVLDISKAFDRVWHAGLLHKFSLTEFQVRYLTLFLFSVIDGFKWFWIGSPHKNIQLLLKFLINDLTDDVICDIVVYADDTTLYSKCDQAYDLWQQLELASELQSDLGDTVD